MNAKTINKLKDLSKLNDKNVSLRMPKFKIEYEADKNFVCLKLKTV